MQLMTYFVIENGKHKRADGRNASSANNEDYGQVKLLPGERLWEDIGKLIEITGWHNSATRMHA